jgi:hypothetical protein
MAKQLESETKLQYISPDLMDFDPTNPRFAGLMSKHSQDKIQREIFGEPFYASELVDSLVENGFIDYEPLVVKRKGKRFIVVEGNRRLAAIKEIREHPDKYAGRKSDLEHIPTLIFPDKPDKQQQNEMRVYLGVRHLLGFREWPPLSKARFLEEESKQSGGIDAVIKETRITRAQARRFLVPFRLLNRAKLAIPPGEDFWVLGEALQRAGIKGFLQLEIAPRTLEVVSFSRRNLLVILDYLYGPLRKDGKRDSDARVVRDTRDLSRLGRVLGSEDARPVLRASRSLEEAEIYVDTRDQSVKRLAKITKELQVLLKKLSLVKTNIEGARLRGAINELDRAVRQFTRKAIK